MKLFVFIISMGFGVTVTIAQTSSRLTVGVSNTFPIGGGVFSETAFLLGPRFDTSYGNIGIYGAYQFSTVIHPNSSSEFHVQLVGGILEYRMLNSEKKISPYTEISIYTVVSSNHKNQFLDPEGWIPIDEPIINNSTPYFNNYIYLYESTPLAGHFLIGCDFLLTKGLNFAIGAGYGAHIVKVRNAVWSNSKENIINNPHNISFTKFQRNFFDVKVRLSYSFSFKKTKKP